VALKFLVIQVNFALDVHVEMDHSEPVVAMANTMMETAAPIAPIMVILKFVPFMTVYLS
jgi:hypothetical protein